MKKQFLSTLILLLFLNLLIKPLWVFGIDIEVQKIVKEANYGMFFPLLNLSFLLNIILDFGIIYYNNRNIARHNVLISKSVSNIVAFKLILGIFYAIISVFVAFILHFDKEQMHLVYFLIFNQFLLSFILYLRSNISGLQLFKTDSLLSVLDKTLMIIICGILIWNKANRLNFKIEWFVYAQTLSYIITSIIIFIIVLSKCEYFHLRFDYKFFLVILRNSWPYALMVFLMSVYKYSDSLMLERILPDGKFQAGIYAQSYRIYDFLANYGLLFAALLLPMFAKMIKQKQVVGELVKLSYLILLIPSIAFVIASWFFRKEIMDFLFDNPAVVSSEVFGLMMIAFVFQTVNFVFGALLTANGSLKILNTMAGFAVIINLLMNFILIPQYKVYGVAIACLSTQFFTAVSQIFLSVRIIKLKINFRLVFIFVIFVLLTIGVGLLLKIGQLNWIFQFVIIITSGLSFALILRLIQIRELFNILFEKD